MKKLNKKGAEMTIGTIVIIVLALIVLVVLIVGFTGGWGNLWGRITAFFGGENVDSIVSACNVACSTNAKYDYCERVRTLKVKEGDDIVSKEKTCNQLEEQYGLEKCGAIDCGGGSCEPIKECTVMSMEECETFLENGCVWNSESETCSGTRNDCEGKSKADCVDPCNWK